MCSHTCEWLVMIMLLSVWHTKPRWHMSQGRGIWGYPADHCFLATPRHTSRWKGSCCHAGTRLTSLARPSPARNLRSCQNTTPAHWSDACIRRMVHTQLPRSTACQCNPGSTAQSKTDHCGMPRACLRQQPAAPPSLAAGCKAHKSAHTRLGI